MLIERLGYHGMRVKSPELIAGMIRTILAAEHEVDQDKEHFWTIGLNTQYHIQYVELVSLGSLRSAVVHPREVFRLAVMKAVERLIVTHNHPSGHPYPSQADIALTRLLVDAGKVLDIPVVDHIVVGNNEHYSFAESGLIFAPAS